MIRIGEVLEKIKMVNDLVNGGQFQMSDSEYGTKPLKDNSIIEALFLGVIEISVIKFIDICDEINDQNEKWKFISTVLNDCEDELSEEENKLIETQIMPMIDLWRKSITKSFDLDNLGDNLGNENADESKV